MIIAIPALKTEVEGRKLMSPHFGKAPGFLFIDDESGREWFVENPKAHLERGGGRAMAALLSENGANVLLVKEIGPGAFEKVKLAGVEIYSVDAKFVDEAIDRFKLGKAEKLDAPNEE
jgi:predicted Fe-Mo cluster-binding NifX family protein